MTRHAALVVHARPGHFGVDDERTILDLGLNGRGDLAEHATALRLRATNALVELAGLPRRQRRLAALAAGLKPEEFVEDLLLALDRADLLGLLRRADHFAAQLV